MEQLDDAHYRITVTPIQPVPSLPIAFQGFPFFLFSSFLSFLLASLCCEVEVGKACVGMSAIMSVAGWRKLERLTT